MRIKGIIAIIIPIVVAVAVLYNFSRDQDGVYDRSINLSDLHFHDYEGQPVDLSVHEGKYVVLNIWATWCAPCRKEMPQLEDLSKSLPSDEYVILGVSVNEKPFLVQEFLRDYKITFAKYIDIDNSETDDKMKVEAFPTTLFFDRKGQSFYRIVGERDWTESFLLETFKNNEGES